MNYFVAQEGTGIEFTLDVKTNDISDVEQIYCVLMDYRRKYPREILKVSRSADNLYSIYLVMDESHSVKMENYLRNFHNATFSQKRVQTIRPVLISGNRQLVTLPCLTDLLSDSIEEE